MNSQPDYTVIIPHRNSPELLRRCLNSIPVDERLQVVVVDDKSDPEQFDAEAFHEAYPSVEFVCLKCQGGAGAARNTGLEQARGRWLLFADADDFFLEGWLEIVGEHFNSKADIIYFNVTSVDSSTLEPAERNRRAELSLRAYFSSTKEEDRESIRYCTGMPWAKMFRRSVIEEHKVVFEQMPILNDVMFVFQAGYYAGEVDADMRPIYCVTFSPVSITYANGRAFRQRAFYHFHARLNTFLVPRGKVRFTNSVISEFNRARKCGFWDMFRFLKYQFSEGRGPAAWRNIAYWLTHKHRMKI